VNQTRIHDELAFHLVSISLFDRVKKAEAHMRLIRNLAKVGAKRLGTSRETFARLKSSHSYNDRFPILVKQFRIERDL
jgi:hypothetical protein